MTYKIGGRCTQVNYILCSRCNLKAIQDCKVVSGENMEIIKRKQVRVDARAKLWELKKEECLTDSLDRFWVVGKCYQMTAEVLSNTTKKVVNASSDGGKNTKWQRKRPIVNRKGCAAG